jgi:hypothetical protein
MSKAYIFVLRTSNHLKVFLYLNNKSSIALTVLILDLALSTRQALYVYAVEIYMTLLICQSTENRYMFMSSRVRSQENK